MAHDAKAVGAGGHPSNLLTLAVTVGFVLFLLGDAGAVSFGAVTAFFVGVGVVYLAALVVVVADGLTEQRNRTQSLEPNRSLMDAVLGRSRAVEGFDPDRKPH